MWTHQQLTFWCEGTETHCQSCSKSIIMIWRASLRNSKTLNNNFRSRRIAPVAPMVDLVEEKYCVRRSFHRTHDSSPGGPCVGLWHSGISFRADVNRRVRSFFGLGEQGLRLRRLHDLH